MAQERVERRLAAILAADVVGYSRLVGMDEEGTIARLKVLRKELFDPSIAKHKGRIVKTTGDGILVEFPSVVDAVRNAVEVQRALAERDADLPEDRRIEFRVGVNLGDIVIDGDDILGDGVNVAARLEGLAAPGGICIPRKVFEEVRNNLDVGYEFIGDQKVKNIEKPIPVYRVLLEADDAGKVIGEKRAARRRWQWEIAAAVAVIVVAVAAVWWRPWEPAVERASLARMAFPLPKKPSIAVLPFDNLSGDPKQDFFVDGFTENIITALAKIPRIFVIARNSTFTYKGKPVKVQLVAEELGVRYVLEGSVQRAGGTIRITAQLIDALSGKHVWAERYDRSVKDVFALQDEITLNVVTALQVRLTDGEKARLARKETDDLEAYLQYYRGTAFFLRFRAEDNERARTFFQRAVELDPKFTNAWVGLAWAHQMAARFGWSASRADSYKRAAEIARKALSLDDVNPSVHNLLSAIYRSQRKFDESIAAGRKAIALGPNISLYYAGLAVTMYYAGEFETTVSLTKKAMRLHPRYPTWYLYRVGVAYRMLGRYGESVAALEEYLRRSTKSSSLPLVALAATYSMMGRESDARGTVAQLLKVNPKGSLKWVAKMHYFKDPAHLKRILDALREVGLPE